MGLKENLKTELAYRGMLVKELAAKSGVKKSSINNYLNVRGQIPSVEAGVKIAQALGVSVEYLVTGREPARKGLIPQMTVDTRYIVQLAERLDDKKRKFVIDFIKWIGEREE
jgi:transcriptional regulator with XRE-family HTH domain